MKTTTKSRAKEPKRADLSPEERERQQQVARDYAQKNRERIATWSRNYRRDHPEVAAATDKRKREKAKIEQPGMVMLQEVRKRARKQGLPFDLDVQDIQFPEFCPILGIPLEPCSGHAHDASPSLDRLVPEKGYVKGNCFIISNKANRMKQDNTLDDFHRIIAYIQERLPQ